MHKVLYMHIYVYNTLWGFPGGSDSKEAICLQCRRLSREDPLQYSCLENSMDREAWQATDQGVAKSQTQLSE